MVRLLFLTSRPGGEFDGDESDVSVENDGENEDDGQDVDADLPPRTKDRSMPRDLFRDENGVVLVPTCWKEKRWSAKTLRQILRSFMTVKWSSYPIVLVRQWL